MLRLEEFQLLVQMNTGCQSVKTILTGKTTNPVVNLPGCPVHPTVLIQSLLDLILIGNPAVDT